MTAKLDAEVTALRALGWLAGDDDRLATFLAASGTAPSDVRGGAQDPDFLAAVLDFLLQDEASVIAFCTDEGLAFDAPLRARVHLPGGEAMHWT